MELSIGIFNNRNSWIQQIFRLAQQFMIKRGRRGSREREWGNYSENQYFILKVWKCIKLSLKKTSAKICDLVISSTPKPFCWVIKICNIHYHLCHDCEVWFMWKYRNHWRLILLHEVAAGLATQSERKFWVFCRFFSARPEKNRHQVDALVHLWPVCQGSRQGSNFIRGTADAALQRAVRSG